MKEFNEIYTEKLILSCDIENLEDYFNFIFKRIGGEDIQTDLCKKYKQIRYNPENKTYIFECYTDKDIIAFANFYRNFIIKNESICYYYNSTGYDKPILNILLELVDRNETDLNFKLRRANDYIIYKKIRFKLFRSAYWENFWKKDNKGEPRKKVNLNELFKHWNENYLNFYKEFKNVFTNKAEKYKVNDKTYNCIIQDVQVIGGFNPSETKSGQGTYMSLKDLQLLHLGEQQKFDFGKYKTIKEVKEKGLYKTFIDYSENDVNSQIEIFKIYVENKLKNRFYAIKAVKDENLKDIDYNINWIFSETETKLICGLVGVKTQDFTVDYREYIKTEIPEFNDFVEFVQANQKNPNDNELKAKYKEKTGKEVAEFQLNGVNVLGGYGGCHGATPKYTNNKNNLYLLDYTSHYPVTIITHKHLFKNIMNVELYEAVFKLRVKYKKLKKEAEKQGNEELIKLYDNLQGGLKLILNSTYGLINSTYKIPIANKILGRFVCLKCQELLYNLCTRNSKYFAPNLNTDGVAFELPSLEEAERIVKEDFEVHGKGLIQLEIDKVEWIIQNDVNNYIMKIEGKEKPKVKGQAFNVGIKQKFNNNNVIDINISNAIKILSGKKEDIQIEKVYFKGMKNLKNKTQPYYFTTKDHGVTPITTLTKSTKLTIDNKDIYVTEDIEKADINLYIQYAEFTVTKIKEFNNRVTTSKYYEHELTTDTDENNTIFNKNINRVKKLLDINIKDIGYCGFLGKAKSYSFINNKPINPLINYNKTEIKKSQDSKGIAIKATDKLIIVDFDIYDKNTNNLKQGYPKELIEKFQEIVNTYKTWNDKTKDFGNFKLIFKNDINKILDIADKYSDYIEILDTSIVWTMEGLDRQYFDNDTQATNASEYIDLLNELCIVKSEDAKKYIEDKATAKEKISFETDSNNIVLNTILNILKNENIDIYSVDEDKTGLHISTPCPYCQNKGTQHYKNNIGHIDAYININQKDGYYVLNINNLSQGCKKDKEHTKYYNHLSNLFKKSLPNKRDLDRYKLIEEIKENIDLSKLVDDSFFIEDTIKIVGTGGGKTFQTACRLAKNLFINDIFTIVTTKQNSNIEDFDRTFKKVIKLALKRSTKIIDKWLESDKGVEELFIHKLKNVNPIKEDLISKLKGVVTNHKYFYNNGHIAEYNNNMIKIREEIKETDFEIIVDEYESFKEMGVMTIPLNNYQMYKLDIDTKKEIYEITQNCFYPCVGKLVKSSMAFEHAIINTKQSIEEMEGINTYKLNLTGDKDLLKEFYRYCQPVGKIIYDCGRRTPKKFSKDKDLYYIVCDKIQQYKTSEIEDGLNSNFKQLLYKNEYIAIVTQVVKVSTVYTEGFDVNLWGEELSDITQLLTYLKNKGFDCEEVSGLKDRMITEGKELYIKNLALSIKSILSSFKCPKYYLTANVIKDNDLAIDTTLAYQSSKSIKNIDVAVIDRIKNNDQVINENLHLLKDRDFKTLVFNSLARNVKKIINKKIDIPTEHIVIKSVLESGDKSVNVDTTTSEDIDDDIVKTVTLAYVNGTESQGRNYSKSELLIINGVVDINVKGRLTINENGEIIIKNIEDASSEKLKQAFGRIFRGEQTYKSMLILGDYELIKSIFEGYGKNYSINFNLHKYNKTVDRKNLLTKAMADIVDYFDYRLCVENDPQRNVEKVDFFNTDLRKKAKSTKYDIEEVFTFYTQLVDKYYNNHGKKPKDKELIPEIKEQFKISEVTFKRIKRKFQKK